MFARECASKVSTHGNRQSVRVRYRNSPARDADFEIRKCERERENRNRNGLRNELMKCKMSAASERTVMVKPESLDANRSSCPLASRRRVSWQVRAGSPLLLAENKEFI